MGVVLNMPVQFIDTGRRDPSGNIIFRDIGQTGQIVHAKNVDEALRKIQSSLKPVPSYRTPTTPKVTTTPTKDITPTPKPEPKVTEIPMRYSYGAGADFTRGGVVYINEKYSDFFKGKTTVPITRTRAGKEFTVKPRIEFVKDINVKAGSRSKITFTERRITDTTPVADYTSPTGFRTPRGVPITTEGAMVHEPSVQYKGLKAYPTEPMIVYATPFDRPTRPKYSPEVYKLAEDPVFRFSTALSTEQKLKGVPLGGIATFSHILTATGEEIGMKLTGKRLETMGFEGLATDWEDIRLARAQKFIIDRDEAIWGKGGEARDIGKFLLVGGAVATLPHVVGALPTVGKIGVYTAFTGVSAYSTVKDIEKVKLTGGSPLAVADLSISTMATARGLYGMAGELGGFKETFQPAEFKTGIKGIGEISDTGVYKIGAKGVTLGSVESTKWFGLEKVHYRSLIDSDMGFLGKISKDFGITATESTIFSTRTSDIFGIKLSTTGGIYGMVTGVGVTVGEQGITTSAVFGKDITTSLSRTTDLWKTEPIQEYIGDPFEKVKGSGKLFQRIRITGVKGTEFVDVKTGDLATGITGYKFDITAPDLTMTSGGRGQLQIFKPDTGEVLATSGGIFEGLGDLSSFGDITQMGGFPSMTAPAIQFKETEEYIISPQKFKDITVPSVLPQVKTATKQVSQTATALQLSSALDLQAQFGIKSQFDIQPSQKFDLKISTGLTTKQATKQVTQQATAFGLGYDLGLGLKFKLDLGDDFPIDPTITTTTPFWRGREGKRIKFPKGKKRKKRKIKIKGGILDIVPRADPISVIQTQFFKGGLMGDLMVTQPSRKQARIDFIKSGGYRVRTQELVLLEKKRSRKKVKSKGKTKTKTKKKGKKRGNDLGLNLNVKW